MKDVPRIDSQPCEQDHPVAEPIEEQPGKQPTDPLGSGRCNQHRHSLATRGLDRTARHYAAGSRRVAQGRADGMCPNGAPCEGQSPRLRASAMERQTPVYVEAPGVGRGRLIAFLRAVSVLVISRAQPQDSATPLPPWP